MSEHEYLDVRDLPDRSHRGRWNVRARPPGGRGQPRSAWTDERMIAAAHAFAEATGAAPASRDWNIRAAAPTTEDALRRRRYMDQHRHLYPHASLVIHRFGSWQKFLDAAGLQQRKRNAHGMQGKKPLSGAKAAERDEAIWRGYQAGDTVREQADKFHLTTTRIGQIRKKLRAERMTDG